MDDFLKRLMRLLQIGYPAAEGFVATFEGTDPLQHTLGLALLASARGDTAAFVEHAQAAVALDPEQPRALATLAMAQAETGGGDTALVTARMAVSHDATARSWETLGVLLLEAGRFGDAEEAFRSALEREEDSPLGLRGIALARWRRGDQATALRYFARALGQSPNDPSIPAAVIQMYGEAGWPIGAHALGKLLRGMPDLGEEAALLLDLVMLRFADRVMSIARWSDAGGEATATAEQIVESVGAGPHPQRVAAARRLALLDRWEAARDLIEGVVLDEQPPAVCAMAHHVRGLVAGHDELWGEAVQHYERAVEASPERWDACCNALQILLEDESEAATERMSGLVAGVPELLRRQKLPLAFNEALFRVRAGELDAARALLEHVVQMADDDNPLLARATEVLATLAS